MLGWEFPPFISGGLGTACFGLTRALDELETDVLFVLPRPIGGHRATHVTLVSPPGAPAGTRRGSQSVLEGSGQTWKHVAFREIDAALTPYLTPEEFAETAADAADVTGEIRFEIAEPTLPRVARKGQTPDLSAPAVAASPYSGDLFAEAQRYAALCTAIARSESFDVVHAHDWMTFPAGIAVAAATGRPLVVHVHATEFDRSGDHVNQRIYDLERAGMHAAAKVIAVSHLTRNIVTSRYGVPAEKVEVVYNAVDDNGDAPSPAPIRRDEKIVLFLGRITMQKGPEYFIAAARKVLDVMDNVRFVMAGSGDMIRRSIELAAQMGIGHKLLFTGFLRGDDVARVFKMADLYVMPSVSEPFGISALEALSHDVPAIISKQSGVAEVLRHVLKVDFWDIDEMANKIIAVLRHPPLHATLREHGAFEVRKLTWRDSAERCLHVYSAALGGGR